MNCFKCCRNDVETKIVLSVPEGFSIARDQTVYEANFCSEECERAWKDTFYQGRARQ